MNSSHTLKTLIDHSKIQHRVAELAEQISQDYQGKPLTLVGVMTGSLLFMADLMRRIGIPHQVGVIQASSYGGTATSPGTLTACLDYLPDLSGRDVLLLDDILDTGQTLQKLLAELQEFRPASLKTAVLLWKHERTEKGVRPDYFGFPIENQFVVGYGLDFDDNYRHLSEICIVEWEPEQGTPSETV